MKTLPLLTSLTSLKLGEDQEAAHLDLIGLTNLTELECGGETFLPKATNLKRLALYDSQCVDDCNINMFQHLERLTIVGCFSVSVASIASLPLLTSLNILNVTNNRLFELVNLRNLEIKYGNPFTDECLGALTNLESLSLLYSASLLKGSCFLSLNKLTSLYIEGNVHPTLTANLPTTLKELTFYHHYQSDMTDLPAIPNLERFAARKLKLNKTLLMKLPKLCDLSVRYLSLGSSIIKQDLRKLTRLLVAGDDYATEPFNLDKLVIRFGW